MNSFFLNPDESLFILGGLRMTDFCEDYTPMILSNGGDTAEQELVKYSLFIESYNIFRDNNKVLSQTWENALEKALNNYPRGCSELLMGEIAIVIPRASNTIGSIQKYSTISCCPHIEYRYNGDRSINFDWQGIRIE